MHLLARNLKLKAHARFDSKQTSTLKSTFTYTSDADAIPLVTRTRSHAVCRSPIFVRVDA
ncbi:hypothetical protein P692DRAFT_201798353 [Suillus brevipes Sb2]|nr:hypothetical protein P692DRAFT_201798353 [Suillus brevipes Sb2]